MELTTNSILEMHPLDSRLENEEEVLIGRSDISNFIILPTFAVDIIELLDSGWSIERVAQE
ncbi:MAG: PqqD family protein, partial [Clostridia bacterium]